MDFRAFPLAGNQRVGDDGGQQHKVDAAFKAEFFFRGGGIMRRNGAAFPVIQHGVKNEECGQQDAGNENGLHQQVHGGPEEAHALEEAEEKGRVAKRTEGAADVGNEEDEEDDLMHTEAAVLVGPEQGADKQHGRSRGAHPAGNERAYQQDARIHNRGARQRAFQADAAGHGKQGEQQQDEGHVFQQQGFRREEKGRVKTEHEQAGHQKGQPPEYGHFAEMVLPEVGDGQRAERDGQQHARKGNDPDDGQILRQRRMRRKAEGRGQQQRRQNRREGTQFGHTGLLHDRQR